MDNHDGNNSLYRLLPSVDRLLSTPAIATLLRNHSRDALVAVTRVALDHLREEISAGHHTQTSLTDRLAGFEDLIASELNKSSSYSLRRVINATGVILHTNLGRAPLSSSALAHVSEVAKGYSNLELDLASGERGHRDAHVESLILKLLARKASYTDPTKEYRAVVVNNCAAATFLALNALAEGREVIISRGELVEIGGGFRIPEILQKSGALLHEVGTTNRTRVRDYEQAVSSNTALILRVHQSNFHMEGFVTRPSLSEIVALGKRMNVPVFEDQGTGLLFSLEQHGVLGQPTLLDSYREGCDLIAASGDKLLGGPQCGLLIGRKDLIERIRRNPLLRTYRVDKLTYAALEATLFEHLSETPETIPIVRMLSLPAEEIHSRCQWIVRQLCLEEITAEVVQVTSLIGGGTAPGATLPSYAIALRHAAFDASAILSALRQSQPSVIGRINEDRVVLDLRTIEAEFDDALVSLLNDLLSPRMLHSGASEA